MNSLSPKLAAEFAHIVYGVLTPDPTGIVRLETTAEMDRKFNIDLGRGPVTGRTGGLFGLYRQTTGFALHGEGINSFRGHHVIAVRGTKTNTDWLTNGNVGLSTSIGGSSVHAGFNKTFESMKPALDRLLSPVMSNGHMQGIHCVGHSLGGALASLTADWVKNRYRKPVKLYTFGAPRVGMTGYATAASHGIDSLHRCTHGADPVPNVPLWPFIHAPANGSEYRLDNASGISVSAHGMSDDDVPGYRNTANVEDWSLLQRRSDTILSLPVRLDYERRYEAFFSSQWADKLKWTPKFGQVPKL